MNKKLMISLLKKMIKHLQDDDNTFIIGRYSVSTIAEPDVSIDTAFELYTDTGYREFEFSIQTKVTGNSNSVYKQR